MESGPILHEWLPYPYVRYIGNVKLSIEKNGEKEVLEKEGLWEQMFFGSNKDAIIRD